MELGRRPAQFLSQTDVGTDHSGPLDVCEHADATNSSGNSPFLLQVSPFQKLPAQETELLDGWPS